MNILKFITSKKHDAFTLVEFIVIMSIFAVMVGVVMFNFNGFRSAVTLDNLAHDIGISIRQIQTSSGASLSVADSDPTSEVPRGISFYPDPETPAVFAPEFKLFKDSGNGYYVDGDEVLDTIKIQTADRITGISYVETTSNQIIPIEVQSIGITFKRYKTDAMFMTSSDGPLNASALVITVASPVDPNNGPERVRNITISKIGQVSIK